MQSGMKAQSAVAVVGGGRKNCADDERQERQRNCAFAFLAQMVATTNPLPRGPTPRSRLAEDCHPCENAWKGAQVSPRYLMKCGEWGVAPR